MSVAMEAQGLDVRIGLIEVGDGFAGEVGGQALLPELVFALDLAFGLGGGSVTEGDAVEMQGPAELGQGLRLGAKEQTGIIDVEFQRQPVVEESGRQKIEVGQEQFTFVELGRGEEAAAVIEHVEHGKRAETPWEPSMRGGIQLPQFTDLTALPAFDRRTGRGIGLGMSQVVFPGPATNLSPIELELAEPEHFAGGEAIGGRGPAREPSAQQLGDQLWPSRRVIPSRGPWHPTRFLMVSTGPQIGGVELVESTARKAQMAGSRFDFEWAGPELGQHMADQRRSTTMNELLPLLRLWLFIRRAYHNLGDAVPQTPGIFRITTDSGRG